MLPICVIFWRKIENVDVEDMWLQRDVAKSHTTHPVLALLHEKRRGLVIQYLSNYSQAIARYMQISCQKLPRNDPILEEVPLRTSKRYCLCSTSNGMIQLI